MTVRLVAADFVEGILAVAAARGLRRYSMASNALDQAMASAYEALAKRIGPQYGVEARFRVKPHPVHGSSPVIRAAVEEAVSEHLVARRNPTFRYIETTLCVDSDEDLEAFLNRLPGSAPMYLELADVFVAALTGDQASSGAHAVG